MALLQPTDVIAVENSFAALRVEHDDLLGLIHGQEESLGRNFVRLASIVYQVQQTKAWIDWGHKSFNDYLTAIGDQIDRKRGQIYNMLATVRLLPSLSETDLLDLGVTKASVLKDYARDMKKQPPPQLVEYAKNPATSVEDLRAQVYTKTHGEPPEGQKYYKIAYVATPGQQETIQKGFSLAAKMAKFPEDLAEHSKTAATLEVIMQEFIGTYEGQVV